MHRDPSERPPYALRLATVADIPRLEELIAESARGLGREDYSAELIEAALGTAWGVDSELIRDGTYFVVQAEDEIVACGGWSHRRTLFGGDDQIGRVSDVLDCKQDAARIRALFVRPDHARRGIGRLLLERSEAEAFARGFRRTELMATLPGQRLYAAFGYAAGEPSDTPLCDGLAIRFVPMMKELKPSAERLR